MREELGWWTGSRGQLGLAIRDVFPYKTRYPSYISTYCQSNMSKILNVMEPCHGLQCVWFNLVMD